MKLNIKNNSNKNSGFVCGMTRKIAELVLLAFGISLIVFCYLFDLSGWRSEIAIFLIPPALVMTDYLRKILRGSIYSWFKVWETGIKIFLSSSVMIYFFGVIGGWQSDASSVLLIASFMALILFTIFFILNLYFKPDTEIGKIIDYIKDKLEFIFIICMDFKYKKYI